MTARRHAHVSMDRDVYERAQEAAKRDRRPLANWLTVVVERALDAEEAANGGKDSQPAP